MNKKYVTISLMLVLVSFVVPAHAVQLDAAIPKGSEEFSPVYTFTRIVSIQYAEDSKLAELFGDAQQKISFVLDSGNAAVLIEKINSQLAEKSFVIVDDVVRRIFCYYNSTGKISINRIQDYNTANHERSFHF